MRAWLSLAVMFAAVAVLGTWVYLRPQQEAADNHALSTLKASAVARIRIERTAEGAGSPATRVALERTGGAWRIVEPFTARTDPFQVERLLSILDARSAGRYPAADLARYGLAAPFTTLTLDEQSFSYGAVNTITREQYVLTRDAVYAIPLAQRNALPRDANALLAKTLFGPDETPLRFELPGFTAALEDGKWVLAPEAEAVGADERVAWVDGWRRATAVQAARHAGGKPESTVTVTLKDGRTLSIGVLQREPELVLLRADEGVQYHFFADAAKRLLSPPAARSEVSGK